MSLNLPRADFIDPNGGYPTAVGFPNFKGDPNLPWPHWIDVIAKLRLRRVHLPLTINLKEARWMALLDAQKYRKFLDKFRQVRIIRGDELGRAFSAAARANGVGILTFDGSIHDNGKKRNLLFKGRLPLLEKKDRELGEEEIRLVLHLAGACYTDIDGYDYACRVFQNDGIVRPDLFGRWMFERDVEEWGVHLSLRGNRQERAFYPLPLELR